MFLLFNVEESTRYGQISISALGLDTDLGFSRGQGRGQQQGREQKQAQNR